jgi:hypothetical protein
MTGADEKPTGSTGNGSRGEPLEPGAQLYYLYTEGRRVNPRTFPREVVLAIVALVFTIQYQHSVLVKKTMKANVCPSGRDIRNGVIIIFSQNHLQAVG